MYSGNKSWSDLQGDAGLPVLPAGPHEVVVRRALGRLLHIDDRERIAVYRQFFAHDQPPDIESLSVRERRLFRMLVGSLVPPAVAKDTPLREGAEIVWTHLQLRAEMLDLLGVLAGRIDHVGLPLMTHRDVPLVVHARYTRREILAALDRVGLPEAALNLTQAVVHLATSPKSNRAAAALWRAEADVAWLHYLMREALVFGNRPVPSEKERQEAVSLQVQEIRDRQAAGLLPADLDPGHLRLLGFALMNYPRMLPQITRMATGMTPDNPSFVARWEALLKEVGSWIEEAARHQKALPAR